MTVYAPGIIEYHYMEIISNAPASERLFLQQQAGATAQSRSRVYERMIKYIRNGITTRLFVDSIAPPTHPSRWLYITNSADSTNCSSGGYGGVN